jgi:hypothetical protein
MPRSEKLYEFFVVLCNTEQQTAEYEQYIQELLNSNKQQATLHKF